MSLLGESEYVLRIVAFVAGCASLVLLYQLLSKTSGRYGILFALLACACSYYLVYYSAELKQYSSDVLVSLILALFFYKHVSQPTTPKDFWMFGFVGVAALCFSHPAVFVLIGMGITLLIHFWKDRQRLLWTLLMGAVWGAVFLVIYLVLLRYQTTSDYLITFWRNLNSFMPIPPWRDVLWFPYSLEHLFTSIGGLSSGMILILLPLYLYGLWAFWKDGKWQWSLAGIIPIGINMIVSGLRSPLQA